MKTLNSKKIIFIIFFIIGVILFSLSFIPFKSEHEEICQGTVIYQLHLKDHYYTYNLTHRIFFSNENVGYDSLRGFLTVDGMTYIINRTVNFYQKKLAYGRFEFSPTFINKAAEDNIPDQLFVKYFPFMTNGALSYFKIDDIGDNRKIITGNNGRFLACSIAN